MKTTVRIVGGGLAGAEAAYRLLNLGYDVVMYEMRPTKNTPAHQTAGLAELVCSNSLKSVEKNSSSGLLKTEMRALNSLVLKCAEATSVPAGGALAVDRAAFSAEIERELRSFENFRLVREEFCEFDDVLTIVATGPLTSDAMVESILQLTSGNKLSFFDAVAPIVSMESLDMSRAYFAARYGKGEPDYVNCEMTEAEYRAFYNALVKANTVELHGFERAAVFEGCMPIEVMAKRGEDTMRFGPLRPVGLTNPDGSRPYAVVQLRKENVAGDALNLVGFQTNLTFGEQKRVFSTIPALANAEFLRYGVMHRNTFLDSPNVLEPTFRVRGSRPIYVGGQLSGVEGYMESATSGLLAAINLDRELKGLPQELPPDVTLCGALSRYVAAPNENFQPMNTNFGLLPSLQVKGKKDRYAAYALRAESAILAYADKINSAV